ncbi:MAG: type I-E CRISPR-associated protein Cas6/Cse3/CasE, partial [Desulfovibrio sp.]|nr:type I-E CRISPR-associated protein Cas6/Cse3/CasE [Desulfovibrio sp.]
MSWLARLTLSREDVVRQRLFDTYDWHQAVWQCFPNMSGQKRDFLMRLDWLGDTSRLYILSGHQPIKPMWCPINSWAVKEISSHFLEYTKYRFDLLANPTKKLIIRDSAGLQTKGKRVPLVHEDEQRKWLENKGK